MIFDFLKIVLILNLIKIILINLLNFNLIAKAFTKNYFRISFKLVKIIINLFEIVNLKYIILIKNSVTKPFIITIGIAFTLVAKYFIKYIVVIVIIKIFMTSYFEFINFI